MLAGLKGFSEQISKAKQCEEAEEEQCEQDKRNASYECGEIGETDGAGAERDQEEEESVFKRSREPGAKPC